ncbi:MAG: CBS domain-containing protein [Betaproteobacteria bacterium]|jgi:acetoin utilization protein AcuB|nr:CBS domain-containing protein [Betaproteobacteria bacterium]
MQVRKYMSAPAITVRADADYRTAFDVMRERDLHHLPVVDAAEHLVGIVALRDMLVAATRYQNAPVEIGEVMRRPVISTQADLQVVEAARLMRSRKIGCLPIVNTEMNVLGVITESDLLEVFVRMLSSTARRTGTAKRKVAPAKHKAASAKRKAAKKKSPRKAPKRAGAKRSVRGR